MKSRERLPWGIPPRSSTPKSFELSPAQEVDTASLHWTNYVMCGYKGVFDFLNESGAAIPQTVGLDIMIDGTVPTGSGLSSSSALCCAVAVAVMHALGLNFTKGEIADFTCNVNDTLGLSPVEWIRLFPSGLSRSRQVG